ncbi:MAG: CYTH domain-containing protein [Clostridia bacterium]
MIEREIKEIISKEKYEEFQKLFDWHKTVVQTNHYFTAKSDVLKDKKITVRVRETAEKNLIQIKVPQNFVGALHVSKEIEREVEKVPETLPAELMQELLGFETGELSKIGSLKTTRMIFDIDKTELCLDKNEYLGITDYEVEIEFFDKVDDYVEKKCKSADIHFQKEATGKFARFVKNL